MIKPINDDKYQGKYRTSSARLNGWDYGSQGLYFVTICTKDRVQYFGEIKELSGEAYLQPSEIGEVALNNWLEIPNHYSFVELNQYVVMPDHIHGIIYLNKPDKSSWEMNKFGPQKDNLASIMRGYKSSIKGYANLNAIEFGWQSKYYDRVIRNEKEYLNIRSYIQDNPANWLLNNDNLENLYSL